MTWFLIVFAVALAASACGFKKYVWFISIGYGAAVAAIGVVLLLAFGAQAPLAARLQAALLVAYGVRLAGYLAYREVKSRTYNQKMRGEIKSNDGVGMGARVGIWVSAALLYACETSPVLFRMGSGASTDVLLVLGLVISVFGLAFETAADLQKSAAKRRNPRRFVDSGLYRIVRCPNYLGELLIWTGVFVSGLGVYAGVAQWVAALAGYLGIVYVMFGGARRLEMRQNRSYGKDPAYQAYVRSTPILIPFVPLYSVEKYTWLVA